MADDWYSLSPNFVKLFTTSVPFPTDKCRVTGKVIE